MYFVFDIGQFTNGVPRISVVGEIIQLFNEKIQLSFR